MKRIMIITGLLLILCLAWGQMPYSLRNYALGSVMDGEWEHIYDPIELNFYDQTYYFTNLSEYTQHINLYDENVQFVEESRFLSEYPFGFTFGNPFHRALKHSLLIRFKDNQLPNLSNGAGVQEMVSTMYSDTDSDLIYDLKDYSIERVTDYEDMAGKFYFLLNSSLPVGDDIFGVRISYDNSSQKWDEATYSFFPTDFAPLLDGFSQGDNTGYYYYNRRNLIDDILTQERREDGKFRTTMTNNNLQALFSYMMPSAMYDGNSELRYDLNISYDDANCSKTKDSYEGEFYQWLNENSTWSGLITDEYNRTYSMPRTEVLGSVKLRRNLDDMKPRYKQGFWEIGLGLGGFGGSYLDEYNRAFMGTKLTIDTTDVASQQFYALQASEIQKNEGSYLGFRSLLSARSSLFFSEYVCFGYGVNMDLQTFRRESDNDHEMTNIYLSRVGELFDTIEDMRNTVHLAYMFKQEMTQTTINTVFPVGLEFSLPKSSLTDNDSFTLRNFTFRLGTTFHHLQRYTDWRNVLDDVEVYTNITEYGDGNVSEYHPTGLNVIASKESAKESRGFKRFTAGLGYEHSDYLNIDFGGYVDSNMENYFIGAMFTVKR